MFDKDRWTEIFYTLKSNKLRTFLTAFGVFWGIFMLIIMLGAGKGLENAVIGGFGDFATNSCFIWTDQTSKPYKGFSKGRRFNYRINDTQALLDGIPEINIISPRTFCRPRGGGNVITRNLNSVSYNVFGDYPEWNLIDPVNLTHGRFINKYDVDQKRKIAVIGDIVKTELFKPDEDPINQYIMINGVYYKVVGVFKSRYSGDRGTHDEERIHIPITTAQQTYNMGNEIGWFAITSKPNIPVSIVEDKAIAMLKERHSVAPDDDRAIGHFNLEKEYKKMRGLFIGINILVLIVGTGTLLAGIIGVSNIMLVAIRERTKEIGIKRAIGARPRNIINQIISEAVALTILSGFLGLAAGVGIVSLVDKILRQSGGEGDFFKNPEVDLSIAIGALIILVLFGVIAGLIPARMAVRIKPVEAMRTE